MSIASSDMLRALQNDALLIKVERPKTYLFKLSITC